jgi:hypothetical protein
MNFSALSRSYSPFLLKRELLNILTNYKLIGEIQKISKYEIHQEINNLIIDNYHAEDYFKSILVNEFVKKKVVAAFEVKVNSSRLDFLTINDYTQSFEIKTSFDTFNRLEKQIADYSKVFEFNNIVVSTSNMAEALQLIPNNYGVWIIENGKKKEVKKAERNTCIDPLAQLLMLTKSELNRFYNSTDVSAIVKLKKNSEINLLFKSVLKARYAEKWKFVASNRDSILPIDLQYFFKNNIHPNLIYS